MRAGAIRWRRASERIGRAGAWLFLSGILASVAASLAGWKNGWDLATITLSYPGLLMLLGSIVFGDAAMLCMLATRAPGKRGHWFVWVFLACRGGALLLFFLAVATWAFKLLAATLSG